MDSPWNCDINKYYNPYTQLKSEENIQKNGRFKNILYLRGLKMPAISQKISQKKTLRNYLTVNEKYLKC